MRLYQHLWRFINICYIWCNTFVISFFGQPVRLRYIFDIIETPRKIIYSAQEIIIFHVDHIDLQLYAVLFLFICCKEITKEVSSKRERVRETDADKVVWWVCVCVCVCTCVPMWIRERDKHVLLKGSRSKLHMILLLARERACI